MSRIITCFLAVLMTSAAVLSGPIDAQGGGSGVDAMGRSTNKDPWARQFEDEHGPERTKFDPNTDDEVIYRSHRIFPDGQNESARQQWIVAQKQRAIANEINRTKALIYPVNGR